MRTPEQRTQLFFFSFFSLSSVVWVQIDTLVGAHMAFRELSENLQGISGHLCRYLISASPCLPPVPMPRDSLEYVARTWGSKTLQSVSRTCATTLLAGFNGELLAVAGATPLH